jgi:RNA polymerase sporulation-specific sigma factor
MKELLKEKRKELLIDYKLHDNKEALKELTLTFLDNIEKLAIKYENQGLEHDEIVSIAIETTIRLINKFDYNKDIFNLTSYINIVSSKNIESQLKKINNQNIVSYEQYMNQHKNGEDNTFYDNIFELDNKNEMHDLLEEQLKRITKKQADVIRIRYGLIDHDEKTFEEVGKILGFTSSDVQQKEKCALTKLRKFSL